MHELFITALVPADDLPRTLKILQGFCAMRPTPILERRLIMMSPASTSTSAAAASSSSATGTSTTTAAGFQPIDARFIAAAPAGQQGLWAQLNERLRLQRYLVTLIYAVGREEFGQAGGHEMHAGDAGGEDVINQGEKMDVDGGGQNTTSQADAKVPVVMKREVLVKTEEPEQQSSSIKTSLTSLNDRPGTLRWNDWPEPIGGREVATGGKQEGYDRMKGATVRAQGRAASLVGVRPLNSRACLHLERERALYADLLRSSFTYATECIHEAHRFVLGNVVFHVSRYWQLPATSSQTATTTTMTAQPNPNPSSASPSPAHALPLLSALHLFDAEDKWILTASVEVAHGKDQEAMARAHEELLDVRARLDGCFELQVMHRNLFDTRVRAVVGRA